MQTDIFFLNQALKQKDFEKSAYFAIRYIKKFPFDYDLKSISCTKSVAEVIAANCQNVFFENSPVMCYTEDTIDRKKVFYVVWLGSLKGAKVYAFELINNLSIQSKPCFEQQTVFDVIYRQSEHRLSKEKLLHIITAINRVCKDIDPLFLQTALEEVYLSELF